MKVLLAHNEYGRHSGEETLFHGAVTLLRDRGHEVETYVRSSAELGGGSSGKVRAFVSGIWSIRAKRDFARRCDGFRPDVVQVQNLFPLISTSFISAVCQRHLPLVLSVHNYRLFCPTGLMLRNGVPCELCATGGEWNAVRYNCEGSLGRSIGYAVRNRVARPRLLSAVNCFTVLSKFQRSKFEAWGVPPSRISVVPNFVDAKAWMQLQGVPSRGFVGFAGRLSTEKGFDVLVETARLLPEVQFEAAGHVPRVTSGTLLPRNLVVRGELRQQDLLRFYHEAALVVVPSICYEGFGYVAAEAMLCERPVIASRVGGLVDVVDDGVTGYLATPGDATDLASKICTLLFSQRNRAREMGEAGRRRILENYSVDRYYDRLMAAFALARDNAEARLPMDGLRANLL